MTIDIKISESQFLPDSLILVSFLGFLKKGTMRGEVLHAQIIDEKNIQIVCVKKKCTLAALYLLVEEGSVIGSVLGLEIMPNLMHVVGFHLDTKRRGIAISDEIRFKGNIISRRDGKCLSLSYLLFGLFTYEQNRKGFNVVLEVTNYNEAAISLYRNLKIVKKNREKLVYRPMDISSAEVYAQLRKKKISDKIYVDDMGRDVLAVRWSHIPLYNNVLTWSLNRIYSLNELHYLSWRSRFHRNWYSVKLLFLGAIFGSPFLAIKFVLKQLLKKFKKESG